MSKVYLLKVAYVGTGFFGWQSQPERNSIQDYLESALQTFLRHPVKVIGASRTDTGVHAEEQMAIFSADPPFEKIKWMRSLKALLPSGIGVKDILECPERFHPIASSKGKAYRYRLWQGEGFNPFIQPFVWQIPASIDVSRMVKIAPVLVGKHDFTSFCAVDSSAKTKVRTVWDIRFERHGDLTDIWVSGEGFLKQMIRNIVGTLVDSAAEDWSETKLAEILAAKDRTKAGRTAPPQGLSLVKIFYDKIYGLPELMETAKQGFCLAINS